MAAHAHLKTESMKEEKYHYLMSWLNYWFHCSHEETHRGSREDWSDCADAQSDLSLHWTQVSLLRFCSVPAHFDVTIFISECLPTEPLHPPSTPENDAFLHPATAYPATSAVWIWVRSLPIPEDVLPCSHLHSYTTEVRKWVTWKSWLVGCVEA